MATVVYGPRAGRAICAITETIGPQRCSIVSNAWHCVSISWACGCVPMFASPPNRQLVKTMSPRVPAVIAARARSIGSA